MSWFAKYSANTLVAFKSYTRSARKAFKESQERELSTLHQEKAFLHCKLQRIQRRLSKFTSESQKDSCSGSDTVPIFAFGRPLPAIVPRPFQLRIH